VLVLALALVLAQVQVQVQVRALELALARQAQRLAQNQQGIGYAGELHQPGIRHRPSRSGRTCPRPRRPRTP
jgi:hypothetical protein